MYLLLVLRFLGKREAAQHLFIVSHLTVSFKIFLFLFYISLHAVHGPDSPIYGLLLSGRTTSDTPFHEMSEYSCYCLTKHVLLSFPKNNAKNCCHLHLVI